MGDAKDSKRWAAGTGTSGCWWHLFLGTRFGSSWVAPPQLAIGFWGEGRLNETPLWSVAVKPRGPDAADDTGGRLDEIKSFSSAMEMALSSATQLQPNLLPPQSEQGNEHHSSSALPNPTDVKTRGIYSASSTSVIIPTETANERLW